METDSGLSDKKLNHVQKQDPKSRYFSWKNILIMIFSMIFSFYLIFQRQAAILYKNFLVPEETLEYVINLQTCKIPDVYDGQSELPFFWDSGQKADLFNGDFNCDKLDVMSIVINDTVLKALPKLENQRCCLLHITRPEYLSSDLYSVTNACSDFRNEADISDSEYVLLQCKSQDKTWDFSTHSTVPIKENVAEKLNYWNTTYEPKDELPFSVAVIVVASTSRSHAYRSLPKTLEFLEDTGFVTMKGYNTMQDGYRLYANNILSLITGNIMPESVEWIPSWDTFPSIWSQFDRENFITLLMDDSRHMLTTGGRNRRKHNRAYVRQPTDYYLKPFLEAHADVASALYGGSKNSPKGYCIGNVTSTKYLLEHLLKFQEKFVEVPTFSFSYFSWPQFHHGLESLSKMDGTYKNFFQSFLGNQKTLDNTVVVLMSDQGGLNHPYFHSEHGKIERLNPLLMIKLPKRLLQKHPKFQTNLQVNSHRLVSPIDVHRSISIFSSIKVKDLDESYSSSGHMSNNKKYYREENFGNNLFIREIPEERNCSQAFIPEDLCLCNQGIPKKFNGRTIMDSNGVPEKYWRYSVSST